MITAGIFSTLDDVVNKLVDIYNAIICIPDEAICWIETGAIYVLNLVLDVTYALANAIMGDVFVPGMNAAGHAMIVLGVETLNVLISGIADATNAVLSLLPNMPDIPGIPDWVAQGYSYVCYWFPVGFFFAFLVSLIGLYVAWLAIAVILRWARAVGGTAV